MRVWIETTLTSWGSNPQTVTLYVRVWIETIKIESDGANNCVTLYVRVWIETRQLHSACTAQMSHPLREGVD